MLASMSAPIASTCSVRASVQGAPERPASPNDRQLRRIVLKRPESLPPVPMVTRSVCGLSADTCLVTTSALVAPLQVTSVRKRSADSASTLA